MSSVFSNQHPAIPTHAASPAVGSPSRQRAAPLGRRLARVAALAWLAMIAGPPAFATLLPPFAEEWSPPGQPEDVDVDVFGRVWIACADDSVRVYEPRGGTLLFAFGGSGVGDGQFQNPFGIQFAPDGTVYICDYGGARIERFTSEGDFIQAWPVPSERADHVAVDDLGDVYVTGFSDGSVHKYDSVGNPLISWPSAGGGRPSGVLAVGGILHMVSWETPAVEQFALDGTFLGSFPVETSFGVDLEQDALGQIWLADWSNHVIRVYTAGGEPLEVLGEPGADPGQFNGPIGIAFGTEGSVYVADQLNGRVQRFGESSAHVSPSLTPPASSLALRSIAPNPSRGPIALTYSLRQNERVRVTVADVSGRRVATLADAEAGPGEHRLAWDARRADGRPLPAGTYVVRLQGEHGTSVGRLVVVR